MATGDAFARNVLDLILRATAIANIADNAATSPETNHNLSLNTASPDTGTLATSETTYTSYVRLVKNRSTDFAAATGAPASSSPAAALTFAAGTGGSGTVTHWGIGKTGGGAALLYFAGTVTPNIVVGNGVTPELTTATAITLA